MIQGLDEKYQVPPGSVMKIETISTGNPRQVKVRIWWEKPKDIVMLLDEELDRIERHRKGVSLYGWDGPTPEYKHHGTHPDVEAAHTVHTIGDGE